MGNSHSRLSQEELKELLSKTHFTKWEIMSLYQQFRREADDDNSIGGKTFQKMLAEMRLNDTFFQQLLFNVFDADRDGKIKFGEFVKSLSVMMRGDPEERLEFGFKMYDLDRSGFIERNEMLQVVRAFYAAIPRGRKMSLSGQKYATPEDLVDDFFAKMDIDKDGKISMGDYKMGAIQHPDVLLGLKLNL